jgi:hypothetical protein
MQVELTQDQLRLLILISKFSKPTKKRDEVETWIKKIPLMSLINRGIQKKVFEDYDFAPMLVEYIGQKRFANISKEGEDDIADIREMGLIERLKLATSHHVYVSAYRITHTGLKVVKNLDKEHHKAVLKIIKCKKCGGTMNMEAREDAPYLICSECGHELKVDIFDIEEVPYVSVPVYSKIWNPPD